MRRLILYIVLALVFISFNNKLIAQEENDTIVYYSIIYIIETYNGGQFIGTIIKQDDREVLIETKDRGKVTIPKYEIKEIKEVKEGQINQNGEYIPDEIFSTRYFITTNGLPIKKGENYILWNLYGPEVHFGLTKNFGVGLMTTWIGVPIIGSVKYSFQLNDKMSVGLGTLLGTGSWASSDFALGLPYGTLTYGDRRSNINISAGYGVIAYSGNADGNALLSIAGMAKVGMKISLVFDSFIVPRVRYTSTNYNSSTGNITTVTKYSPVALIIPGIRIQGEKNRAFQFGFAGIYTNGDLTPLPIPFVQWFRKF